MKKVINSKLEEISSVILWVEKALNKHKFDKHIIRQICVVVDEIVSNIVLYAYTPSIGRVSISIVLKKSFVKLMFVDKGRPYNPLENNFFPLTEPLENRRIGGLGILVTKAFADEIHYQYKNCKNVLSIIKLKKTI